MRILLATLLVVAALMPARAHATPNFPPAIVSHLGAKRSPACRICHVNGLTGLSTVNTPFGLNLRTRGVLAYDEKSLVAALDALRAERIDSSGGRGSSDIDVLTAGGDPNSKTPSADLEDPIYGCGATFARRSAATVLPPSILLLLALARRARRP